MTAAHVIPDQPGGWRAPWGGVFELARLLPEDRWVLVGGLMVQAHAFLADVETARVTIDVDAAVHVEAGVYSYAEAASALLRIGYAVDVSTRRSYRFVRGSDVVDLMVADHLRPAPRFARRDVMTVAGGRQALDRRMTAEFVRGVESFAIPIPSLHGALVLKAAAYTADSRLPDRHLLDVVTLLACIVDVPAVVCDLRGSDRARLRRLVRALDEKPLLFEQVPDDTGQLARRTWSELRVSLTDVR